MKSVKIGCMIGLLLLSNNIFCESHKSMNQAIHDLYHMTHDIVYAACVIGWSSYVVDWVLSTFQATRNLENRGNIATGSCAALYALFLISAEYQKINDSLMKNQKKCSHFVENGESIDDVVMGCQEDGKK